MCDFVWKIVNCDRIDPSSDSKLSIMDSMYQLIVMSKKLKNTEAEGAFFL